MLLSFYWSLVNSQGCVSFRSTAKWFRCVCVYRYTQLCVCTHTHTLSIYCCSLSCVQLWHPWTAACFPFETTLPNALSCSVTSNSVTPWTVAHLAPLSMGIFQAKILEWLPCPLSGDLPNPRIEPRSSALQADSLPSELPGKPNNTGVDSLISYHKILTVVLCAID